MLLCTIKDLAGTIFWGQTSILHIREELLLREKFPVETKLISMFFVVKIVWVFALSSFLIFKIVLFSLIFCPTGAYNNCILITFGFSFWRWAICTFFFIFLHRIFYLFMKCLLDPVLGCLTHFWGMVILVWPVVGASEIHFLHSYVDPAWILPWSFGSHAEQLGCPAAKQHRVPAWHRHHSYSTLQSVHRLKGGGVVTSQTLPCQIWKRFAFIKDKCKVPVQATPCGNYAAQQSLVTWKTVASTVVVATTIVIPHMHIYIGQNLSWIHTWRLHRKWLHGLWSLYAGWDWWTGGSTGKKAGGVSHFDHLTADRAVLNCSPKDYNQVMTMTAVEGGRVVT